MPEKRSLQWIALIWSRGKLDLLVPTVSFVGGSGRAASSFDSKPVFPDLRRAVSSDMLIPVLVTILYIRVKKCLFLCVCQ